MMYELSLMSKGRVNANRKHIQFNKKNNILQHNSKFQVCKLGKNAKVRHQQSKYIQIYWKVNNIESMGAPNLYGHSLTIMSIVIYWKRHPGQSPCEWYFY